MSMGETVARSIDPVGWRWFDQATSNHPAKPIFRDRALKDSRAAIAALREPTEAMVNAAYEALDKYDISQPGACTVKEAYRAMIDAALRDE